MKKEAERGFAGNFNSDDEADLHTFFLESMKKNPEFLKTQYAVFQKEQPFLNELLENLEESERDKLHSLFYDFPLPHAFTPYQHCIFQDEKSPAAVLWATLFPQEEA